MNSNRYFRLALLGSIVFLGECHHGCGNGTQQMANKPNTNAFESTEDQTTPPTDQNCANGCTFKTKQGTVTIKGSGHAIVEDTKDGTHISF